MRRRLLILLALVAAAFGGARVAAAQQADVIRGRIVGPDSVPVEGARITVTTLSGNVSRQARTDRNGRFTVTFANGEGDYMVAISALGFAVKRFEVKRTADEDILLADARLTRAAVTLDAMKVTAPREKVARNDVQPDVGGTEQPVNSAALPAADLGDLAAMAATLPGVQLVPGQDGDPNGFSVLGLGADQNNTTLNGMAFGGSSLPRDAQVYSSLVTSPYDVARGGFSGGQFMLRTRGGSNFSMRGMSLNLDSPRMQWTDRAARSLGQQYSNVSVGGMAAGALSPDKAFYNLSYQFGRRANDYQSLLNTDPVGLEAAGVAADSVNRLLGILAGEGVPATVGGIPLNRQSDNGSVFGSIDFAPPTSNSGQSLNLTFNGGWNRQNPLFSSATGLPSATNRRIGWNGGVMARHTTYVKSILSETSFGVSGSTGEMTPYLRMPSGRVRVSSDFPDGESVQSLSFGGSQLSQSRQQTTTVGYVNQLSWFSTNNKHRLKLTSELRRDGYAQDQAANLLGSWSFNSLAELEAGEPASFTRTLSPRRTEASQLVGGVSLGDSYRPKRDVQIQYGVRVDANHFLDAPAFNSAVESAFGARNDFVPGRVYFSPRLGFSWTYGSAPQISSFEGAARVPRAVVRGGVGLFQSTPQTQVLGSALDNTGLPSGVQQITCVGTATPIPDWAAYAANPALVPDRCADGSTGTPFANTAPNVTLFDRSWNAPRSLRSNLQWNGPVLGNRFNATLEGTYSRNMNQQGALDLNFDPASGQGFTLSGEGNRPVFVDPSAIVPTTGAIATPARRDDAFGRVSQMRSDLLSESRQLRLSLSPTRFSTGFSWSLSYVYGNVRERVRGFTGTTAGNPLDVDWARSSFDSRHQIVYNLGYNLFDAVRLSWYGQFRSGTPFTPMIAGDVNGDGWSNDRAYVFRPEDVASSDPALAASMQSLLAGGSGNARKCLASQLGRLAARNSCQGPWTSTATMSVSFNPQKIRMPQRASVSFQLSNPLGAADLLMHGSNGLHGWGQSAMPDNQLLYVRGFDAATNSYRYEVNQRFGATDPARSAFRNPVTLTAMIRLDVGPTRERQQLTSMLDRGRTRAGDRIPEQFLKAMFANGGGLPNPMATILRQQDSLRLTSQQADSIAAINRRYVIKLDSIWAPVAKYLGALPNDYDQGAAYDEWLAARRATVDLLAKLGPVVKGMLTPEQQRKLPAFIASHLEPRYLASIRSGTVAFAGGGFTPPGAGGGDVNVTMGGGGGERIVIIR